MDDNKARSSRSENAHVQKRAHDIFQMDLTRIFLIFFIKFAQVDITKDSETVFKQRFLEIGGLFYREKNGCIVLL